MSTKRFKFGSDNGNNVKGGKNNTRTILTAAGVIALGAAAGGAGYAAGAAHVNPAVDDEGKLNTKLEEKTEIQSNQQAESMASQQPINNNDIHESTIGTHDEVDPNFIAQQIVNEQNIDPYDIDSPTIISVDELATLYREDGSEMLVAAVHTPDGEQYLLADIDDDGFFTNVFDMSGNYIGEAEGNLMASDLEIMVDESAGYLAQNGDELRGDDPTNDIVNTSNPTDNDIAENSIVVSADEDVLDEELLAQLLEDKGGEDERLVYDEPDDSVDDDFDDNDIDHDDILNT